MPKPLVSRADTGSPAGKTARKRVAEDVAGAFAEKTTTAALPATVSRSAYLASPGWTHCGPIAILTGGGASLETLSDAAPASDDEFPLSIRSSAWA